MVQPGIGLDTPRTNLGDATYLTNQPDFDISQELSFQSPSKNDNLVQQLRNGRRDGVSLRTPRNRAPLRDRKNIPSFATGGEFTPLLKSATRNSALKIGKENGIPRTPAFLKPGGLDNIAEDLSPVPNLGSSVYDDTRNGSYMNATPAPQMESSSTASTPLALPRRADATNVLHDGNQLSLREQENVIDKIEKENFGLKLKIHFLEEALRKAGPGYSEAALKENTDLKVDKVTMQKELLRYRKTLSSTERDLDLYKQQVTEMQAKAKTKASDENQLHEIKLLQRGIDERDGELKALREQVRVLEAEGERGEKLRDEIGDLEADLRERDRIIDERDDEIQQLKGYSSEHENKISDLEEAVKVGRRREVELEELVQSKEDAEDVRETIDDLERDVQRLRAELDEVRADHGSISAERDQAMADLQELQEEMCNKSMTTKGFSRQTQERANRLNDELEEVRKEYATLLDEHATKSRETASLSNKIQALEQGWQSREKQLQNELEQSEHHREDLARQLSTKSDDLRRRGDEKNLLQVRHDALTSESSSLQTDLVRAQALQKTLEDKLEAEKVAATNNERTTRTKHQVEIEHLQDELEDLRADIRQLERQYDEEKAVWESERVDLKNKSERLEERAVGLQRSLDKVQEAETTLSGKDFKLQEMLEGERERHSNERTLLTKQMEEIKSTSDARREALEQCRAQLCKAEDELQMSRREESSYAEKVEALEDEIEVLQTTLDDESEQARSDLENARQESVDLQSELHELETKLDKLQSAQHDQADNSTFRAQLGLRLQEINAQLGKIRDEKEDLGNQLALVSVELQTVRNTAVGLAMERDELKTLLQHAGQHDHAVRPEEDGVELHSTNSKLERETSQLQKECHRLEEQLRAARTELEQEVEQTRIEEERLTKMMHENEMEFSRKESVQKETIRALKRRLTELEHQTHTLDVLQLNEHSISTDGVAASREEIHDLRQQLTKALLSAKELRTQLKNAEQESARKISSLNLAHESAASDWDDEKFGLEREISSLQAEREDLLAKTTLSEQTVIRLKSKVSHLELELQHERRNSTDDRTMALERRDLHDMLRETQIRASELEMDLQARTVDLSKLTAREEELRAQLKRTREDRTQHKISSQKARENLDQLQSDYREAEAAWEAERQRLTSGVRFPNMSLSEDRGNESLLRDNEGREKRHTKELRGLAMQIDWLRARCKREEGLRADAAFAKNYMAMQIELYGACNQADLALLRQMGIAPEASLYTTPTIAAGTKKPTFRNVALMVRAMVRMRRGAQAWQECKKLQTRIAGGFESMRKRQNGERSARMQEDHVKALRERLTGRNGSLGQKPERKGRVEMAEKVDQVERRNSKARKASRARGS